MGGLLVERATNHSSRTASLGHPPPPRFSLISVWVTDVGELTVINRGAALGG